MDTNEQNIDLSEYRVLSIEDNHKIAIINILNSIILEPMIHDLSDTKAVVFKFGSLIELFDDSFITSGIGGQSQIKLPAFELMDDSHVSEVSGHIRNWLISYYNADSLIESLKLEDGIQEEISMAALLILNVFHQLKESLPQVKEQLDQNWIYLSEFDDQLESMWKTDKAFSLLQTELECERIQRLADKQKLSKLEKEVNSYKRKVKQSKEMLEKLKKFASKPAPKSKKRGGGAGAVQTPTSRRGRPKKGAKTEYSGTYRYSTGGDSDVEPDAPPLPGTPVLLSSSGTGSSCRYCGKWFNDGIKLNKHIVIHAGSKPFACDWPGCGRPFDSNYKLQRHRRCHTGERPFACDKCEKRFTRSDKLREHQRLHERAGIKKETEDTEHLEAEEENGHQSIDLPEEQTTEQAINA